MYRPLDEKVGKVSSFVLSLVSGAAVVSDGSDLITNIETSNGKERIETTMQADYTFGLGLKGFVAATLGGYTSLSRVFAGGLLLGWLGAFFASTRYLLRASLS